MKEFTLKSKLKNHEPTIGSWIQIGHPAVAEILAQQGFDWLCVDLEHGNVDLESMTNIFRSLKAFQVAPLVRLPKNDEIWIKRSLDAGAEGIIIPMVNSAEEAKLAVKLAKYPPVGSRGYGYSRANKYGSDFQRYIYGANENLVIIAQIEHFSAIDNLEEILKVPGIDGAFIGPLDLSGSYGKTGELASPEMKTAMKKYLECCKKAEITAGLHIVHPDESSILEALDAGYRFLALGLDVVFLGQTANQIVQEAQHLLKEQIDTTHSK